MGIHRNMKLGSSIVLSEAERQNGLVKHDREFTMVESRMYTKLSLLRTHRWKTHPFCLVMALGLNNC